MALRFETKVIIITLEMILGITKFPAMSRTLQDTFVVDKHQEWIIRYGRVYKDDAEKEMHLKKLNDNVQFIENFTTAENQVIS